MNSPPVYLRPDIQVEPLVDHWYAWPHLIPPATAARNLAERHLKIMDSYISAPDLHKDAVENPKMLGGPFIDYNGKRVAEIRALLEQTKRKRTRLLQLSNGLEAVDSILRSEARGLSLQPLYQKIPPILRGYIELVYDLNNNPSFRLIEPLLYKSAYYARDAQSFMLSQISGDNRPFVLSTPRLESSSGVHLSLPFDHECVDQLFRMKTSPEPASSVQSIMSQSEGSADLWQSFFTVNRPPPYVPYTGTGIRWRYFGHACILIETRGIAILFDPVLSYTYENHLSRYTYQDLPEHIDYVLITHNHQDHVLLETLLQIRHKIGQVVVPRSGGGALQDPSLRLLLRTIGFTNVIDLEELEVIEGEGVAITGLPFLGEHADLDVRTKLAYMVRTPKHTMLFAADSCNIEPSLYDHLRPFIGPVDALFIGMECDGAPLSWLYGPLFMKRVDRAVDQSRRLAGSNCEQALSIVRKLNCKEVYVYAMGQEPWLNHIMSIKYTEQSHPIIESNRLIQACISQNIYAQRLFGEKEILIE